MAGTNRITWQNVAAPDFRTSGALLENAGQLVNSALGGVTRMLDANTKMDMENLGKQQDYWTKMAGIPIQQMGVEAAQEAVTLPIGDAIQRLNLNAPAGILDVPAIQNLLLARVPKARTEATDTAKYLDTQAGLAEQPEVTRLTQAMLNDPLNGVATISKEMKANPTGLRATTQQALLTKAYELSEQAKRNQLNTRLANANIAKSEYEVSALGKVAKQAELDAREAGATRLLVATLREASGGLADIDEAGKPLPRLPMAQRIADMAKKLGDASNISDSWLSHAGYFDPNDTDTAKGNAYFDNPFYVKVRGADGTVRNVPTYIPDAIAQAMLAEHVSSGSEPEYRMNSETLREATGRLLNAQSPAEVADILQKGGYPQSIIEKATASANVMRLMANREGILAGGKQAVYTNTPLGNALGLGGNQVIGAEDPYLKKQGAKYRKKESRAESQSLMIDAPRK